MPGKRRPSEYGAAARPPSQRQLRVGEELRHALAQLLRPGALNDPALRDANLTVTEVRLSPDLRNATVFVMPLGGAPEPTAIAEILAGLKRSAAFLRGQLARAVGLRFAPNLSFAFDGAFDNAERIAAILHRPEVERDLAADPEQNSDDDA